MLAQAASEQAPSYVTTVRGALLADTAAGPWQATIDLQASARAHTRSSAGPLAPPPASQPVRRLTAGALPRCRHAAGPAGLGAAAGQTAVAVRPRLLQAALGRLQARAAPGGCCSRRRR